MNRSQVINLLPGRQNGDVNKIQEQEYIYIREKTGKTCFRVLLKEDVLAGMKRNRSLISVYSISYYRLIAVYRRHMGRSIWLRRNELIFFNTEKIGLEKPLLSCMLPVSFTWMTFQGVGSNSMDRIAHHFFNIYIIPN